MAQHAARVVRPVIFGDLMIETLPRSRVLPADLRVELVTALADHLGKLDPGRAFEGLARAFANLGARTLAARVAATWWHDLKEGVRLGDVLAPWMPVGQRAAIIGGDTAGQLPAALARCLTVEQNARAMRSMIADALTNPAIYLGTIWAELVFYHLFLIPQYVGMAGGAKRVHYTGVGGAFVDAAAWSASPFGALPTFLVVVALLVAIPAALAKEWPARLAFLRSLVEAVPPGMFVRMSGRLSVLDGLALMLQVGLPPSKALESIAGSAPEWLQVRLLDAEAKVRGGGTLWDGLSGILTPMETTWLEVYAQAGDLPWAVDQVAALYMRKTQRTVKSLAKILNLAGLAIFAAVFVFCLFGVFSLIMQSNQAMRAGLS